MKTTELFIEKISGSVVGYYNLWGYLDATARRILSGKPTHKIKTSLEFYRGLFSGEIKHGDRVILKEFFITEWIPRVAGGVAYLLENERIDKDKYETLPKLYYTQSSFLKPGNVVPPFGSSRLPIQKDKRIVLGAVSAGEYHTDLGIVLSVTESVYAEFLSKQYKNFSVEATLEGYVETYDSPVSFPEISQNASIEGAVNFWSKPKYILRIDSPIQIKFRTNSTHPRLNAWVIRRIEYKKYGVGYDYMYLPVENDIDDFRMAQEIITKGRVLPIIESLEDPYASSTKDFLNELIGPDDDRPLHKDISSISCLSEFDGKSPLLDPLIPLRFDPRANTDTTNAMVNYLAEVRALEEKGTIPPYNRHRLVAEPPPKIFYEVKCTKSDAKFTIQMNLGKKRHLNKDCILFPADNKFICPSCGEEADVSRLRWEIESKYKQRIVP